MPVSVLTSKGQTTIPKDIRKLLEVVLRPLKGDILALRGSINVKKKPIDFKRLREDTKKKVARKIVKGMK